MSNVIQFKRPKCCQCEESAIHSIECKSLELSGGIFIESGPSIKKWFCKEHYVNPFINNDNVGPDLSTIRDL